VLSTERDSCGVVAEDSSVIVKHNKKKKTIAAILAFPLPFGILGMHRIFLGTKPYIPFVYIGTAGGCAGILPVADFIAILNADEKTFKKFENNPKVFMWGR
jgi:TM2 domain-containing membrane protein YozV